jgi:hypothetical protein
MTWLSDLVEVQSQSLGMGQYGLGYVLAVVCMLFSVIIPLAIIRKYDISLPEWIFIPMVIAGCAVAYFLGFVGMWFLGTMAVISIGSVLLKFKLYG